MRKLRLLGWTTVVLLVWTSLASANIKGKDLPERYQRWIEEEVFYIITPKEKDVFLQLSTNKERDLFIEAFWKHRDPTVGTVKNEFRDEHYRRLNYVNRRYKYAGKPGWKTDRGKTYIILGEPNDIRIFRSSDAYYPAELWAYQGVEMHGLPSAFNLLFYQRGRIGDYIIYIPGMMGPQSLLANYMEDPTDTMAAYYELEEIQPMLARATISLIPGESVIHHPSMASLALVQNLDGAVIRSIEDRYAQKFIDYKDIVEVEYSANYMDSDAQLQIIKAPSGIPFVHFSVEPKNISVGSYQNSIYTTLEFNGILTDNQGQTIYQFERTVPLNFTKEQFENMRQRPFSFTDKFPVIPGEFHFSYLMKNKVSKEFTSFEANIAIASDPKTFTMTSLLLGFNATQTTSPKQLNKPFVVQNFQFYSQAKKSFISKDNLYVFFQVWSMPENLRQHGSIRYTIFKEDVEKYTVVYPISKYQDPINFLELFPLENFIPGYYKIIVALLNESGIEVISQQEIFEIAPLTYIPRPWVLAQSQVEPDSPKIFNILGRQLLNKKDYERAFGLLEKAFRAEPGNIEYSISFAQVNFRLRRYKDTQDILRPFADQIKNKYELTYLLGQSHQALSEFDKAIRYYNEALDQFGINISLLNVLGECYLSLGEREEALVAFEKSLEIDPNQEKIKELVRSLKE